MLEENWMVLGAGGFIGTAMVDALKERPCRFVAAYRNVPAISGTSFQTGDVNDGNTLRGLLREMQPTVLLNALGHPVGMSESAMPEFYQHTTRNVLDAVRSEVPACRIILLGSAAEYGNSPERGSCEDDALRPLTTYGQAKVGQFELAHRYVAQGINVITARLFNPVGPGQSARQFVGALMKRIRAGEHPLQVHDANHLRDWIDIRDVASALITLASAPMSPVVANVCTGKRTDGRHGGGQGGSAGGCESRANCKPHFIDQFVPQCRKSRTIARYGLAAALRNGTKSRGSVAGRGMRTLLHETWNSTTRCMRGAMLSACDSLTLVRCPKRQERSEGAIFCLHGLGDLLLAGNAVTRLAEEIQTRGLRSVLYVHPELVEFAQQSFPVNQVEGIERHRFARSTRYRAKVIRSIAGRFDWVVQPTYNRMLRVEDCLVRATGASTRIGCAGHAPFITPMERRFGDRIYTTLVPQQAGRMHELERYAEFMAGMGMPVSAQPYHLTPAPVDQKFPRPAKPYLVVCPKASDSKRSWPLENFQKVVKKLSIGHKLAIVIIGTDVDEFAIPWQENGTKNLTLFDLRGKIPTKDLPRVLAGAKLVLANDSGIYHLGVCLNIPTVAVGGGGLPARYFPYPNEAALRTKALDHAVPCAGCDWKCIYKIPRGACTPCIRDVSWQQVAQAAETLLQQGD